MNAHPDLIHGIYKSLFLFIWDKLGNMPTRAAIQPVEDDVLVDKTASHLPLGRWGVNMSGMSTLHTLSGPGLAQVLQTLQVSHTSLSRSKNLLCHADSFKKAAYHVFRGVPPSSVKPSQREPVSADSTSAEPLQPCRFPGSLMEIHKTENQAQDWLGAQQVNHRQCLQYSVR